MPKLVAALTAALILFTAPLFTGSLPAEARKNVPLPVKKTITEVKKAELKKAGQSADKSEEINSAKIESPAIEQKVTTELKGELAALNKIGLTKTDIENLNDAIKAVYRKDAEKGMKIAGKINNETAKKIVEWYSLRHSSINSDYKDLTVFLDEHPGWPSRSRLFAKIEAEMYRGSLTAEQTSEYFKNRAPVTSAGKYAHAEALLKLNKKDEATKLIRDIWHDPRMPSYIEKLILKNHSLLLHEEDHKIRVDRLLYTGRKSKIRSALRTSKKVGKEEEAAARFRAAVTKRQIRHARKLLSKLDKKTKALPGVYLSRVQLARRGRKMKQAANLLMSAKFKPEEITDKDEWWKERRIHCQHAYNNHEYKTAYKIASSHENPTVNHYNEAEFLSGWIALRFLKKPKLAATHFENFKKAADGPRTGSKSAYWMGRTQIELKNKKLALENFKQSAAYFNTYYGQLAAHQLGKESPPIKISEPVTITAEQTQSFTAKEEIQAIILAHLADERSIVRLFFSHLRYHYKQPSELALLAKLASELGYNQSSVRIGKTAMSKGHDMAHMVHYAYPVNFMPAYKPLRSVPEKSLVYSIARQESEFNEKIVSHAGARGLLQVMPATMKYVARKYKVKRKVAWLTQKPAFNAQIASAYIGDRHDEFGGSYIMTFAGFNAGPGRVRQWVKKFGDPRSGHIDPIDWVERIPFKETRNYVQKVLANVQVYRARLKTGTAKINTHKDLYRGKF